MQNLFLIFFHQPNPTQPNIPTHQRSGRTAQIWKRNGASCSQASCRASCRARDRRNGASLVRTGGKVDSIQRRIVGTGQGLIQRRIVGKDRRRIGHRPIMRNGASCRQFQGTLKKMKKKLDKRFFIAYLAFEVIDNVKRFTARPTAAAHHARRRIGTLPVSDSGRRRRAGAD